jgi:hypothetical protein
MDSVTIRIEPQHGPGKTDFDVLLLEKDGTQTLGLLTRDDLTKGRWTANLDAVSPPPAVDIVTRVAGAAQNGRNDPDYGEIGETLHRWLLPPGPVRQRWLALSRARQTPLYVDARQEALAQLPWELARSELPPRLRPALVNGVFRLNGLNPGAAGAYRSTWPFRILIVVGCRKEEEPDLHVAEEVRAIERTFHRLGRTVDVHCMYRPKRSEMMGWVTTFQPHIFHFAGHGGKLPGGGYGLQIDCDSDIWIWGSDAIDGDLPAAQWIPHFVFLNACRSAAERSGNWSTRRSFLAAGAKAVLGMQADMRGDLSGTLASTLYKSLAEGESLEEAIHQARTIISRELPGFDYLDWALPAMTIAEPNLKLFEPRPPPNDPAFDKCDEFESARFFANCREPRRAFTHWVYPCTPQKKPKNVLLVMGEKRTGKSHLLKWCMENWVIGGARVRYIELNDGEPKTFLSVLRQIRDGEADARDIKTQYLHAGLAQAAFRRFNWQLNNLIQTGAPGEWVEAQHPAAVIPDNYQPLTARSDKRLEKDIGAAFLEALKLAAQGNPLILVFDQLSAADPAGESLFPAHEVEQVVRHLLRPLAGAADSPVKIVLSATLAEAAYYQLSTLLPTPEVAARYEVPVDIGNDALIALAAEMMWFKEEETVKRLAGCLLSFRLPEPVPKGLARLFAVQTAMIQFPDVLNAVERMR